MVKASQSFLNVFAHSPTHPAFLEDRSVLSMLWGAEAPNDVIPVPREQPS